MATVNVAVACFSPVDAWQTDGGEIVFAERGKIKRSLKLPCGGCVGCRLERARQWAVRCMHEAAMHESNVFVTLTYNDECLPLDYSLDYRHFQLFMKRLRKLKGSVRFYMCGEYGEKFSRPHFHACLFGVEFEDRYFWRTSKSGCDSYRSKTLEDLWGMGDCELGDVTFQSAGYIARYCVKELTNAGVEWILDPETGEMIERPREFTRMSLKPGIGATWYEKYKKEVFPLDRVVMNGIEMRPPKYYYEMLKNEPGTMADDVEFQRYLASTELTADNTPDRMRVREVVQKARIKSLKRSLE